MDYLFCWKWIELLLLLDNERLYVSKLAKRSGFAYGYFLKILKVLEREGFVGRTCGSRLTFIFLTSKGKLLAKDFLELKRLIF